MPKFFCVCAVVFCLLLPGTASAYLDPGTGGALISAVSGLFAAAVFALRGFLYRAPRVFPFIIRKKRDLPALVLYSEGARYWHVFEPIVRNLVACEKPFAYLSSDENDPGLYAGLPLMQAEFIGTGNKAYAALNRLEADVCAMTMPGLDVFQVRRSPGVRHYAHIVHGAGDKCMYRKFGLDYYDSILASGPHQEVSVRKLETRRNLKPKKFFQSGCAYYDGYLERKSRVFLTSDPGRILVASSWGPESLLRKTGTEIPLRLAEAGFQVTVRPHPQSLILERDFIDGLRKSMQGTGILWDMSPDSFPAAASADLLVADWSGVRFDFAFVMERPVITMDCDYDFSIFDVWELDGTPWDIDVSRFLGCTAKPDDIPHLPELVRSLLLSRDFLPELRKFREKHVYNFGCAGPVIAAQLVRLTEEIA